MVSARNCDEALTEDDPTSVEDEKFDLIYPPRIRRLSSIFWTPVRVAAEAAKMLVKIPGTRVLDIGSGPGKFCLVAASLTDGRFTGVEQRDNLVTVAKAVAAQLGIPEVHFLHVNVTAVDFADYDAFYIFNPFEENMDHGRKIDSVVPLSPTLFKRYTSYVATQLGNRPLGTRVVTYAGYANDVPSCYDCEATLFQDDLKLWVKRRETDAEIERLSLGSGRSCRGSKGWAPPPFHG